MAQRITWQNITAPDMTDAIRARESAATLISNAFSQIGGSLGRIDERNVGQQNNIALNEAMKVNDLASWDRLMSSEGLAGLGINPAQANSALMEYTQGKKRNLLGERASEQAYQTAQFNQTKDAYGFDRTKMLDARADEEYQKALDQEQLRLQIGNEVFKMGKEEVSKDALLSRLENEAIARGWDEQTAKLYMDAGRNQDDMRWNAAPGIRDDLELTPAFRTVRDTLDQAEAARQIRLGTDDTFRFYDTAMTEFSGYKNLGDGLSTKLLGKLDPGAPKDEQSTHAQKAGKIQTVYNNMRKEFKDLPAEMVALALSEHLTDNGWLFTGDQTEIDESAARKALNELRGKSNLEALAQQRSEIDFERKSAQRQRALYDEALTKAALARDDGNEEGLQRALADLGKLAGDASPNAGKTGENRDVPQGPPMPAKASAPVSFTRSPVTALPSGSLSFGQQGGGLPPSVSAALAASGMPTQVGPGEGTGINIAPVSPTAPDPILSAMGPEIDAANMSASIPLPLEQMNSQMQQKPDDARRQRGMWDRIVEGVTGGERAYRSPDRIKEYLENGEITAEEALVLAEGSLKEAEAIANRVAKERAKKRR